MNPAAIPLEETWDLAAIFDSPAAVDAARARLVESLPALAAGRGRLARSATDLADALELAAEAYRTWSALHCYASCASDGDLRVADQRALRQSIELVGTQVSEALSYLRPEILDMAEAQVEAFLSSEARLAPHAFFLRDLLRQRPHVLGAAEERILSQAGLLSPSASALYNVLNNSELPRPEFVLERGERIRLTPVAFHAARSTASVEDRRRMFPVYFGAYRAFRDTLGQNLFNAIKAHLFHARSRGYSSCLAAALDPGNVPLGVYHTLLREVRARRGLLHRYLELRAELLGIERLEYPDLYGPLGPRPAPSFSPMAARGLVASSLSPLGSRYREALARAFEGRWIDWHPAPGKRSGAYATGAAYDAHPFVLLNFTGDFESVSTLAHEMGHAMHSHFSNAAQPFVTAGYPVFVAEVASTVNEALLLRHAITTASDRDERLWLLATYLDGLRGTLFRQAMFAEFELAIHETVERGDVPTGESLDASYLELLRDWHGHAAGVMRVDDAYAVEWAAVPHFYFDFYVYQYATGITAATALAEQLTSDEAACERYLEFLAAGGSDHPLDLLRRAGVDLETAAPYETTFRAFERALVQLRELVDSR